MYTGKKIIIQIKTFGQALLYRHLSNFSLTSATILMPSPGWMDPLFYARLGRNTSMNQ